MGTTQNFNTTPLASNVPCSVQTASASTQMSYAQRQMNATVSIFMAQNIGAQPSDIFVAVDTMTGISHTFQVVGYVHVINARFLAPWRLDCVEMS